MFSFSLWNQFPPMTHPLLQAGVSLHPFKALFLLVSRFDLISLGLSHLLYFSWPLALALFSLFLLISRIACISLGLPHWPYFPWSLALALFSLFLLVSHIGLVSLDLSDCVALLVALYK